METLKALIASLDWWDAVVAFFITLGFIAINWAWSDSKRDIENMYRDANGYGE